MSIAPVHGNQTLPTRLTYDSSRQRLEIVVDVFPASVDDLTVAVGPSRIRITADHPDGVFDRYVTPPSSGLVFSDERTAVYANGVLDVSVGTTYRETS